MSVKINHFDFPLPPGVSKYLHKYSAGNWQILLPEKRKFESVVVIPTLAEYENLRKLLASLIKNDKSYFDKFLILFVVNNIKNISSVVIEENRKSIHFLSGIIDRNSNDLFAREVEKSGLNIGLIDASGKGKELSAKTGGVGLARKIGMDLALNVLDYQTRNNNLLICLDSDCTVEKNYLAAIYKRAALKDFSAGYVRFEHPVDINPYSEAIILYEIFLRYYTLGLKYAESPYAFYTIGSTMISDYKAYVSVEGMNKRKAAEDFYFMEKLAKRFEIKEIRDTVIYPSPRGSWRVPFGTGKAVEKFLESERKDFKLHSPQSFLILKKWLSAFNESKDDSASSLLNKAWKILPELNEFLVSQKFEDAWNRIAASSKTSEQLEKQKKFWFDGFRTLKLIHFLRDSVYPDIDGFEALRQMFILNKFETPMNKSGKNRISLGMEYLNLLRKKV